MSVSDPIADMLTKIRNASAAGHEKVDHGLQIQA
jgi:small subunit ribosomal protein S8